MLTKGGISIHMNSEDYGWDAALVLLGEVLESRSAAPFHLVVCGGAALRAAAIISRVTKDVDVLALRGIVDGEIGAAWPLSEELKQAVADVAVELNLRLDWMNSAVSLVVGSLEELPSELWSDLLEKNYGSRLRISYVGRAGQIPLKLQAALDRDESRDLDDLKALAPTKKEWQTALRWLEIKMVSDDARWRRLEGISRILNHEQD